MKARTLLLLLVPLFLCACVHEQQEKYKDPTFPIEERVNDLVGRMTVEEKIGQLVCPMGWPMYTKEGDSLGLSDEFVESMKEMPLGMCWAVLRADPWTEKTLETGLNPQESAKVLNMMQRYAVENTRLGIPILFAEECPHGHMAIGTTVFPTGLAQASTFDKSLMREMGEAIALEVRSQGAHIGFGPVLDIARDPRWSRMEETFGEDTYLAGVLGSEIVKGMRGDDVKDGKHIYSTLKHFAAYGISEGGLNGAPVNVGERVLLSEYLPQFKKAFDAGAELVMTAYNTIDGVPCTANRHLVYDILREKWGFKGCVISDLYSINVMENTFHVVHTADEAAALALKAGVDVDLGGTAYGQNLFVALDEGLVTMEDIDDAVKNVLRLKFEMGLFENPYVNPEETKAVVRSERHKELARQMSREGVVLLKNDGILPLDTNIARIAVIGPNADMMYNQLGDYTAPQDSTAIVTVLEGIRNAVPKSDVKYVKGCAIRDTLETDIKAAVAAAKSSDVTILVVGGSSARDFQTSYSETGAAVANQGISDMDCGEGYDRSSLSLLGHQEKLMQALIDAKVKLVVVYIQGRPLDMNLAAEKANALCVAWYPGEQGGKAIADVIFGKYNPSGRLPVSIPRNVGQLPVYYSKVHTHDYTDGSDDPLYPFGYGLSYTQFSYSDMKIEDGHGDTLKIVSCSVANTGIMDGDDVVQMYVQDSISSVLTHSALLKGFERVPLKAGETKEVKFYIKKEDLTLFDMDMKEVVEPGLFVVTIRPSAIGLGLSQSFEIK